MKLFKLLMDCDLKKQYLAEKKQISASTISKMAAGDNATMEVIEKVCRAFNVMVDERVDFIPEKS